MVLKDEINSRSNGQKGIRTGSNELPRPAFGIHFRHKIGK